MISRGEGAGREEAQDVEMRVCVWATARGVTPKARQGGEKGQLLPTMGGKPPRIDVYEPKPGNSWPRAPMSTSRRGVRAEALQSLRNLGSGRERRPPSAWTSAMLDCLAVRGQANLSLEPHVPTYVIAASFEEWTARPWRTSVRITGDHVCACAHARHLRKNTKR